MIIVHEHIKYCINGQNIFPRMQKYNVFARIIYSCKNRLYYYENKNVHNTIVLVWFQKEMRQSVKKSQQKGNIQEKISCCYTVV